MFRTLELTHRMNLYTPEFKGKWRLLSLLETIVFSKKFGFSLKTNFGFKFHVDNSYALRQYVNSCEKVLSLTLIRLLKELQFSRVAFIDVGANRGWYSLLAASFPNTSVYAFEPQKSLVGLIQNNAAMNDANHRIEVFNVALASNSGVRKFRLSHNQNDGLAGLETPFALGKSIEIEISTLDSALLPKVITSDFEEVILKLDCEGSEFEIVKGGTEFIRRFRPVISCEVNSTLLESTSMISGHTFVQTMMLMDYQVYYLSTKHNRLEYPYRNGSLIHEKEFGSSHSGNYLFVPKESNIDWELLKYGTSNIFPGWIRKLRRN